MPPNQPSVPKGEIGGSGTYLTNGYLALQDYNVELTGPIGIKIYDKMRKSDATVRVSIASMVRPVLAAHWFMEPADDSEEEQAKADFVEYALISGETGLSWRHFLEESVKLYLSYGRMFYEKVFTLIEYEGKTYIGWESFASRHPQTVMRYAVGEGDQEQFGITQQLPTGSRVEIPGAKLIALVNEKEGDNWEGFSVLRSSYMHWDMKNQLYRIEAIKGERQGMGVPYAQAKPGYTPTPAERIQVQKALRNLRANESSNVEIPAGYDIGWMDTKASSNHDLMPAIEHHDRQIVKNVMAQFIEIGGTGGGGKGSLAASSNQMDLFILSLQAVATYIAEAVQQQAIKQIIDLNWPGTTTYPKLKVDKIGPDNATQLAENLLKFTEAHLLTPTDEDEQFIRSVVEMPDMPEELLGTVDRSFQPTTPTDQTDNSGSNNKPAPKSKASKKDQKQATDALAEVIKLRDEVRAALL